MTTVASVLEAIEAEQLKRAARAAERRADDLKRFYNSWQWKRVRFAYLKSCKERRCAYCGSTVADGERIVVDHKLPVRYFWHLRLDPANLRLACDSCNRGKGSTVDEEDKIAAATVTLKKEHDHATRGL